MGPLKMPPARPPSGAAGPLGMLGPAGPLMRELRVAPGPRHRRAGRHAAQAEVAAGSRCATAALPSGLGGGSLRPFVKVTGQQLRTGCGECSRPQVHNAHTGPYSSLRVAPASRGDGAGASRATAGRVDLRGSRAALNRPRLSPPSGVGLRSPHHSWGCCLPVPALLGPADSGLPRE